MVYNIERVKGETVEETDQKIAKKIIFLESNFESA